MIYFQKIKISDNVHNQREINLGKFWCSIHLKTVAAFFAVCNKANSASKFNFCQIVHSGINKFPTKHGYAIHPKWFPQFVCTLISEKRKHPNPRDSSMLYVSPRFSSHTATSANARIRYMITRARSKSQPPRQHACAGARTRSALCRNEIVRNDEMKKP